MIEPEILFEDDDIIVINKPPGMVVNAAETTSAPTVQEWITSYLQKHPSTEEWQSLVPADFSAEFGTPEAIFAERQGIVHRLDKNTSGVMVLAKNPGALVALLAQFKQRQTTKRYLTLVHGKFPVPEARLSLPLGRASRDRKLFAVTPEGREAVTDYKVLQEFRELNVALLRQQQPELSKETLHRFSIYQGFSLVECWPKTGRTHQIRVHLAHIRHPIVGDTTYLGRKRQMLDPIWCPRQFLHASSLRFKHPRSQKELEFAASLSSDLEAVLLILI